VYKYFPKIFNEDYLASSTFSTFLTGAFFAGAFFFSTFLAGVFLAGAFLFSAISSSIFSSSAFTAFLVIDFGASCKAFKDKPILFLLGSKLIILALTSSPTLI
jgi:hypothetical protein